MPRVESTPDGRSKQRRWSVSFALTRPRLRQSLRAPRAFACNSPFAPSRAPASGGTSTQFRVPADFDHALPDQILSAFEGRGRPSDDPCASRFG